MSYLGLKNCSEIETVSYEKKTGTPQPEKTGNKVSAIKNTFDSIRADRNVLSSISSPPSLRR